MTGRKPPSRRSQSCGPGRTWQSENSYSGGQGPLWPHATRHYNADGIAGTHTWVQRQEVHVPGGAAGCRQA
eukprot:9022561-Pyramimonas_sp.AAC.1